jgi:hypothetical protein
LATLSALSSTLRFSVVLAVATIAVRCGGAPFTVSGDDSDSSLGAPDTSGSGEGAAGDDAADDSSRANDAWTPDASDMKDAHGADAPHADGPFDAPSDQKATTDAPVIHDAAIDIAACASICSGCCDSTGHCQTGNTAAQCGLKGALCADCSTRNCGLPSDFGCCTTAGACGCAVAGIVGCN